MGGAAPAESSTGVAYVLASYNLIASPVVSSYVRPRLARKLLVVVVHDLTPSPTISISLLCMNTVRIESWIASGSQVATPILTPRASSSAEDEKNKEGGIEGGDPLALDRDHRRQGGE